MLARFSFLLRTPLGIEIPEVNGLFPDPYPTVILSDNPWGYWRFEDWPNEVNGNVTDSSGFNRFGYNAPAVTLVDGLINDSVGGYTFQTGGVHDGVEVPFRGWGPDPLTRFSFETIISVPSGLLTTQYIFCQRAPSLGSADNFALYLTEGTGNLVLIMRENGQAQGNILVAQADFSAYRDGEPHHLVFTWDKAGVDSKPRVYMDGELFMTGADYNQDLPTSGSPANNKFFHIGARDTSNGGGDARVFGGTLDEFSVYRVQLTEEQILAHYNASGLNWENDYYASSYENAISAAAPYAHYRLDETTFPVLVDSSGNGRDGNYQGAQVNEEGLYQLSPRAKSFPYATGTTTAAETPVNVSAFGAFTLTGWFFHDDSESSSVLFSDKQGVGSATGVFVGVTGTGASAAASFIVSAIGETVSASSTLPNPLGLNHFACVWDGAGARRPRLYLNSALKEVGDALSGALLDSGVMRLGGVQDSNSEGCPSVLDGMSIFDRAMSTAEIASLYYAGLALPYKGAVLASSPYAYHTLDKDADVNLFEDATGNNNQAETSSPSHVVKGLIPFSSGAHTQEEGKTTGSPIKLYLRDEIEEAIGKFSIEGIFRAPIGDTTSATLFLLDWVSTGDLSTFALYFSGGTSDLTFYLRTDFLAPQNAVITTAPAAEYLDGQPHHFAFTWDKDSVDGKPRLYLDGQLFMEGPPFLQDLPVHGPDPTVYPLLASKGPKEFIMDEIAVYKRELRADVIAKHFDSALIDTTGNPLYNEVMADSPKALWKLNEETGTGIRDYSGNGFDLTAQGTLTRGKPSLVRGEKFSASFLSGVYASRPSLDISALPLTLETWVSPPAFPTGTGADRIPLIETNGVEGTYAGVNWYLLEDRLRVDLGDGTGELELDRRGWEVLFSFTANKIYHVAVVITAVGTAPKMYIEGVEYTATSVIGTAASTIAFPNSTLSVARSIADGGTDYFGSHAQGGTAIYETALSAARISAHYEAGVRGDYEAAVAVHAPVARYNEDGFFSTTLLDSSGNGNDASVSSPVGHSRDPIITTGKSINLYGGFVAPPTLSPFTQISVVLWSRAAQSDGEGCLLELNAQAPYLSLKYNVGGSSRLSAYVGGGSTVSVSHDFDITQNHMVCLTTSSTGDTSLYINGVLVDSTSSLSAFDVAAGNAVNRWGDTRDLASVFRGWGDDLLIYSDILTPAEVLAIYRAGVSS